MKKISMFGLISLFILLFSTITYGEITESDLKGDSDFVSKIMSIQQEDNSIVSNAIYVAVDGSDGNSGTIDSPYATVYYALAKAKAGQTIYIRGGSYNQNIVITKSGSENNYITIKNYPNEKPIFDHSNYGTDGGAIIDIGNVSYIHIEGLTLCNKNLVANSGYGVKMNRGNHIIMKNLEIYGINVPDPTSSKVCSNAIILYGNNASTPISNILIDSCYVHDCETGWSEAISVNGNSEYVNVINCRIKDIGNIGLDFAGNFNACNDDSLDQARYCTAIGNVVSGCVSPNATSYGLYTDGGRDITFDRNIVYECSGGIEIGSEEGAASNYPVKNIVVKNNLIYNNIQAGLSVGGYDNAATGIVYDTKIYNNTLINNGNSNYGKELGINKTNGVDIRNNIFYKDDDNELIKIRFTEDLASNISFKNNCYYSSRTSSNFKVVRYDVTIRDFDNWKIESGETGIYSNPMFDSNYKITEESPCVDLGDSTAGVTGFDLGGFNRVVNTIDIGCYEYQTEGGTTITTVSESTSEVTTQSTNISTTESTSEESSETTTETTTETATETTTETATETTTNTGLSTIWDFTDSNWSDKTTGKTDYEVNGLLVKHNGTSSGVNGFKFDKNSKSSATDGFYIKLSGKKNSTITVYVNYNSGTAKNVVLTLAMINSNGATTAVNSQSVAATKTGEYSVTFTVPNDGEYVIYTDNTSAGSAYYNKVILNTPAIKGDINGDGVLSGNDTVLLLKHIAEIEIIVDSEKIDVADYNGDGVVDLIDATLIDLNSIE